MARNQLVSYQLSMDFAEKKFFMKEKRQVDIQSITLLDMIHFGDSAKEVLYAVDSNSIFKIDLETMKVRSLIEIPGG